MCSGGARGATFSLAMQKSKVFVVENKREAAKDNPLSLSLSYSKHTTLRNHFLFVLTNAKWPTLATSLFFLFCFNENLIIFAFATRHLCSSLSFYIYLFLLVIFPFEKEGRAKLKE